MIKKINFLFFIALALFKGAIADYRELCVGLGDIQDEEVSCYYHFKYFQGMNTKCYVRLDIPPKGFASADGSVQLISLGDPRARGNNAVGTSLNTCKACYKRSYVALFNNYQAGTALATTSGGLSSYTSNLGVGSAITPPAGCNNAGCAIQYFGPSLCPCEKGKPCARQMGTSCDLCNPPYTGQ